MKMMMMMREFINKNIHFSKAGFAIFGLGFGRAMARASFLGFLIVFLENKLKRNNLRHDAVITTAKDCLSALLASVLVYATRRRFRHPFVMILITHAIFLAGIVILYLVSSSNDRFIFLALVLLSLEESGDEFMNEFLSDYLARDSDEEQVKNDKKLPIERRDAWLFIGKFLGFLIGGLVVSSRSPEVILQTLAVAIGIGYLLFFIYSTVEELPIEALQDQKNELIRPLVKLLPLWAPSCRVFNNFVEGIGNLLAVIFIFFFHKWIQDTVDNSHLDKYYRTLAILNFFSLLVFVYLSNTYYWKENIDS